MCNNNVTKVEKVKIYFDNGITKTIDVNEEKDKIVALFWGNMNIPGHQEATAIEILGEFYNNLKPRMKIDKEYCNKKFGEKKTKKIFKDKDNKEADITKDVIRILWNPAEDTESKDGGLVLMGKQDKCRPIPLP